MLQKKKSWLFSGVLSSLDDAGVVVRVHVASATTDGGTGFPFRGAVFALFAGERFHLHLSISVCK